MAPPAKPRGVPEIGARDRLSRLPDDVLERIVKNLPSSNEFRLLGRRYRKFFWNSKWGAAIRAEDMAQQRRMSLEQHILSGGSSTRSTGVDLGAGGTRRRSIRVEPAGHSAFDSLGAGGTRRRSIRVEQAGHSDLDPFDVTRRRRWSLGDQRFLDFDLDHLGEASRGVLGDQRFLDFDLDHLGEASRGVLGDQRFFDFDLDHLGEASRGVLGGEPSEYTRGATERHYNFDTTSPPLTRRSLDGEPYDLYTRGATERHYNFDTTRTPLTRRSLDSEPCDHFQFQTASRSMARRSVDGTPSAWRKQKYSPGATTSKNIAPTLTPTGGEEEQGRDYISALPDELLLQIIALLPTKAGGRTQVLASRWNRLWWSLPLTLQCYGSADGATANLLDLDHSGENITSSAITYILATHPGPARSLRLPASYLQPRRRIPAMFLPARAVPPLDTWLNSRALDGLHEIEFYPTKSVRAPLPVLPSTVFRFASSLRVAAFSQCSLPDQNCRLQFLNLRILAIDDVVSSEITIHRLIAGCPNLEGLLIKGTVGFRSLKIESRSLRTLAVSVASRQQGHTLNRITILNAPSLEIFVRLGEDTKKLDVTVLNAPVLSTFGPLVDVQGVVTRYFIGSAVVSGLRISNRSLVVASVKTMSICTLSLDMTELLKLLKCFPALEKLYIKFRDGVHRAHPLNYQDLQSPDLKLKKIVLSGYTGSDDQVVFARYFVENAPMLHKMLLVFPKGFDGNASWMQNQDGRIRGRIRAPRASLVVEFSTRHCERNGLHILDVHSMSVSDPFECFCGC